METNIENGNIAESLLQDKNVLELLALLKQYKEKSLEQGVYDTVNYVQSLENILSMMMEQMTNMQQELFSMREQNNELIAAVNHTVKDTVIESIQKVEQKVQELHVKLNDVRDRIRNTAKEIVESSKRLGKFTFIKMTDFLHIREGLDYIRQKAENTMESLDSIQAEVEMLNAQQLKAQDSKKKLAEGVKESVKTAEPVGTYQEEMQKFMDARVAEGIQYKTNAEAFEDFKQYYDKRLKVADTIGKQVESVRKSVEEMKCR